MHSAAILAIAQKYVEDARRATRPLMFRDALVAENEIIVKADEFADDLSGFQGYRVQVSKRGTLGRPALMVLPDPPRAMEFMRWAKVQPTSVLRMLLKANGIRAPGTVHVPMAYLLTYLYEDQLAKTVGMPVVWEERKAESRAKRMQALTLAVTLRGVRDEEVMVQMGFWVEHGDIEGQFTKYAARLKEREAMEETKPSDIRKRLMDEGDRVDEKPKDDPKETGDGNEKPRRGEKAKKGEQEAIVAGKGAKNKDEKSKGGEKKEKAKTADENKGEEAKVKVKATGGAKKKEKAEKNAKPASKKNGKGKTSTAKAGSGLKQADFKKDDKVKYIGSRNEELKGKTLEVLGPRGPEGVWVKTSDGTRGSAMAHQLEKIKK